MLALVHDQRMHDCEQSQLLERVGERESKEKKIQCTMHCESIKDDTECIASYEHAREVSMLRCVHWSIAASWCNDASGRSVEVCAWAMVESSGTSQ